jgi:hypothetical protein
MSRAKRAVITPAIRSAISDAAGLSRPLDYAGSAAPPHISRLPALIDEIALKMKIPKSLYRLEGGKLTILVGTEVATMTIPKSVVGRIGFCEQIKVIFHSIAEERAKRSGKC